MSTEPSELPPARVEAERADQQVVLPRWVRRSVAAAAIVAGWIFIAWHNHFHFGPSVVVLELAWAACVSIVYFLFRVGSSTADPEVDGEDWWITGGKADELQREKRTLLKSIREIEFDHLTGKLSDHDAKEMIGVLRARAIEVLKALDVAEPDGGARSEIEREVRARRQVENARKAAKKVKGKEGKAANPRAGDKAADARAVTTAGAASAVDLAEPAGAADQVGSEDESTNDGAGASAPASDGADAPSSATASTSSGSSSTEVSV